MYFETIAPTSGIYTCCDAAALHNLIVLPQHHRELSAGEGHSGAQDGARSHEPARSGTHESAHGSGKVYSWTNQQGYMWQIAAPVTSQPAAAVTSSPAAI